MLTWLIKIHYKSALNKFLYLNYIIKVIKKKSTKLNNYSNSTPNVPVAQLMLTNNNNKVLIPAQEFHSMQIIHYRIINMFLRK